MKKCFYIITVFFLVAGAAYAQSPANDPVPQLDDAVNELAVSIHAKLVAVNAGQVAVGQFTYRGSLPRFAAYWVNQLTGELAGISDRPYAVLSGGLAGADHTISGEIVDVANTIRVYTRLVRSDNRAIEAAFNSDFERSAALVSTLTLNSGGHESSSSQVPMDEWEPDSWEYPVSYEPGVDESSAPLFNRTLHGSNDEDFFLIIPQIDGRLIMETTGSTDTYMEFYSADSGTPLAENDDGGVDTNARIRHNVRAGTRYIVKVRGYSSSTTGHYGFRAYFATTGTGGTSSWDNPIAYEPGVDENVAVLNRIIYDEDDEDYFLIVPAVSGRLTVETTGGIDTMMELYDADTEDFLDEDDDGGQSLNARIRYNVQAGKRYLVVVSTYGGDTGDYGFRAYITR